MIINEYKKTIVVWTDNTSDQMTLAKIIQRLKFSPVIINNENVGPVLKIHCFLIFAKGSLIPSDFFDTRNVALRNGELTVAFIDDSRPYPTRFSSKDTIQLDITKPNDVQSLIKKLSTEVDRFNKRREAMKKKLNRLFYIYTLLKETGRVSIEDVLFRTEISKRTFYRDMEIIKDICVDMEIESTPGCFWNRGF